MRKSLSPSIFLLLMLSACAQMQPQPALVPGPTASLESSSRISNVDAINIALQYEARIPRIDDADGSPTAPLITEARLVTRSDADEVIPPEEPDGQAPDSLIWIVSMDGVWQDTHPPSGEDALEIHHLTFRIDALTGDLVAVQLTR